MYSSRATDRQLSVDPRISGNGLLSNFPEINEKLKIEKFPARREIGKSVVTMLVKMGDRPTYRPTLDFPTKNTQNFHTILNDRA